MAEDVYLFMKANGSPIEGDCSRKKDLDGAIECKSLHIGARNCVDDQTAVGLGSVTFNNFIIHKLIDRASPRFYQALCKNEMVELEAKFFRPSKQNGQREHFYSIILTGGRMVDINQSSCESGPPTETLSIRAEAIQFIHPPSQQEYKHSRSESL